MPRPRVCPRQRRHRLGAQGHPRHAADRPRPGGACRGRAGEGPERDPRGGAGRARAPRAQRSLAGGHRQRRQDRGRDAPQRRRRALRARGRCPGDDGARACATVEAAVRELTAATEVPDTTVDTRRPRLVAADGEARAVGTARRARQGDRRAPGVHDRRTRATGGASDANMTSGMGVPTIDGLGPIGGNDHSPAEYLEVEFDRAAHDAACRAAAGDRARSGCARLAGGRPGSARRARRTR